jgi:hypothetical protein
VNFLQLKSEIQNRKGNVKGTGKMKKIKLAPCLITTAICPECGGEDIDVFAMVSFAGTQTSGRMEINPVGLHEAALWCRSCSELFQLDNGYPPPAEQPLKKLAECLCEFYRLKQVYDTADYGLLETKFARHSGSLDRLKGFVPKP